MNASPPAALLPLATAIGYVAIVCSGSGTGDLLQLVAHLRRDVGGVDDARVGFAELHLGHDLAHVVFPRDDVAFDLGLEVGAVGRVGNGLVQHRGRVLADRHTRLGGDELHAVVGEVFHGRDLGRVVLGGDQDQAVAGEDLIGAGDGVGLPGVVHLRLVGAGEDVGARALFELGAQLARGAEVERDVGVRDWPA